MGDKLSKDFNIREEYAKLPGMPFIGDHDFDVELEKECFMSVNVVRANPKKFIPHLEHVMSLKCYKGKKGKDLIKFIQRLPDGAFFSPLSLDPTAMKACRMNNEELASIRDPKQIPMDGNF